MLSVPHPPPPARAVSTPPEISLPGGFRSHGIPIRDYRDRVSLIFLKYLIYLPQALLHFQNYIREFLITVVVMTGVITNIILHKKFG